LASGDHRAEKLRHLLAKATHDEKGSIYCPTRRRLRLCFLARIAKDELSGPNKVLARRSLIRIQGVLPRCQKACGALRNSTAYAGLGDAISKAKVLSEASRTGNGCTFLLVEDGGALETIFKVLQLRSQAGVVVRGQDDQHVGLFVGASYHPSFGASISSCGIAETRGSAMQPFPERLIGELVAAFRGERLEPREAERDAPP